ncbi:hypothetical protein FOL47_006317 [Perkinsus chesapeaki]|uniref:Uncharacterized protein n=1 Tax=Perkinsus chesapeaki TaxID=330153 RepID=A0A7J6LSL6_PERCH|nr:hypothetical protein FOL47_006317 [Perkinsus chesapeaki]
MCNRRTLLYALRPCITMPHASVAPAGAYISHGIGPRLASPELEKFLSAAMSGMTVKVQCLCEEQERQLKCFKAMLERHKDSQALMADEFQRAKDDCLEEVRKLSNIAVNENRDRAFEATKHFMEAAAVQCREYFEGEYEKQMNEELLSKLTKAAIKGLADDFEEVKTRLRAEVISMVGEHVKEAYENQWKEEMFNRLEADVTLKMVQDEVEKAMKGHVREAAEKVQERFDDTIASLKESMCEREEARSMVEEVRLEFTQVSARRSDEVSRALGDVHDRLQGHVQQLRGELAGSQAKVLGVLAESGDELARRIDKATAASHVQINRVRDEMEEKALSEINRLEERVDEVDSRMGGCWKRMEILEGQLAETDNSINAALSKVAEELDSGLIAQSEAVNRTDDRITALEEGQTRLNGSVAERMENIEQGLMKEIEEKADREQVEGMLRRVKVEMKEINDAFDEKSSRQNDASEISQELERKLQEATMNLRGAIEELANNTEEKIDNLHSGAKRLRQLLDDSAEDRERLGKRCDSIAARLDGLENLSPSGGNPQQAQQSSQDAITEVAGEVRGIQERVSNLERLGDEVESVRKDLNEVARPLLATGGGDTEAAQKKSTLVQKMIETCLEWQAETQRARELLIEGKENNEQIIHAVAECHDRIDELMDDIGLTVDEITRWVVNRRPFEETEIERTFLRLHDPPGRSPRLVDAARDLCAELSRLAAVAAAPLGTS